MANPHSLTNLGFPRITHPANLIFNLLLLLLTTPVTPSSSLNITAVLSPYPDLSTFSSLLSSAISADLSSRNSVTILAVPNPYLSNSLSSSRLSQSSLADVLRFHVILQYLPVPSLSNLSSSGSLFPTLFQTTGRSSPSSPGSLNISHDSSTSSTSFTSPSSNATLLRPILDVPYSLSVLSISSLLIPYPVDLLASSDSRPPLGLNITKALLDGHNFNVAASMLTASGVESEFEALEGGAGITIFVPTDSAFTDLPSSSLLQSLPADKKAVVLKFHVLHSYYPLGSLESIVNPVQPTLATEEKGAGSFTLNISRVNGSLSIDTGIVQASVTQTVFDENPVAIFGISRVLLPREIFGKSSGESPEGGGKSGGGAIMSAAPPPDEMFSPENSPMSSPGSREEVRLGGGSVAVGGLRGVIWCTVVALYLVI